MGHRGGDECLDTLAAVRAGVPADEVTQGIGHRLGEDLGHPDGEGGAEGVAETTGVFDGDESAEAAFAINEAERTGLIGQRDGEAGS